MTPRLIQFTLALLLASAPFSRATDVTTNTHTATADKLTYVIVHGAWGGGWAFKEVERMLRADGHTVYRPTLTGQGEKNHLAGLLTTNIDLNLHITDVVNVIEWEKLQDIVLVGHSYGGMVITGVADRVPDRIKHVIYLDAFVPENGECANEIRGRSGIDRPITNGFVIPTWITGNEPIPHDVPHPERTFSQPISLRQPDIAGKIPTTYILTVDEGLDAKDDAFFQFSERAKARGWTVITMIADHNPQWSKPKELVELLETAPLASVAATNAARPSADAP
jgi:pimeloyl-ACP methyl ester carboxylesterase